MLAKKNIALILLTTLPSCSESLSIRTSSSSSSSSSMTRQPLLVATTRVDSSLYSSMDFDAFGRHDMDKEYAFINTVSTQNDLQLRDPYASIGRGLNRLEMHVDEVINLTIVASLILGVMHFVATINGGFTSTLSFQEQLSHIPPSVWSMYSTTLTTHPIWTKAVTSGTVYAIGDVIAQRSQGTSVADVDRSRVLRSLLAGFIGHGPLSHYWYHFSEFVFSNVLHCTAWWSFLPKIAVDQSIWGPIWNNCYIVLLGWMQRDSLHNMWSDIRRTTLPLVLSGLKLWPLAHCVTYGLLPTEHRLLWVDAVEIVWVTILATAAANAHKEHE